MIALDRNRQTPTRVPKCIPMTKGFWGESEHNELDQVANYTHRIEWLRTHLPSPRSQRLFAVQKAFRCLSRNSLNSDWSAVETAIWFADIEMPYKEDYHELKLAYDAASNNGHFHFKSTSACVYQDAATGAGCGLFYGIERHYLCQLITLFLPVVDWDNRWITDTTAGLARTIYDDMKWDLLPKLSDALQDADCDHPWLIQFTQDTLAPANGCRGWWFLDRLRGYHSWL